MLQHRREAERAVTHRADTHGGQEAGTWLPPGFPEGGVGALCAIREERIAPGAGIPIRAHHDREVLTFVLEGTLEHRDSLGDDVHLGYGDVQRLSAGTGVLESEFNASRSEAVHFVQVVLMPERASLPPCCQVRHYAESERRGGLCLVASRDGRQGTLVVHSDASVYTSLIEPVHVIAYDLPWHRCAWVQVLRGQAFVNGLLVPAGRGACVSGGEELLVETAERADILLVDTVRD